MSEAQCWKCHGPLSGDVEQTYGLHERCASDAVVSKESVDHPASRWTEIYVRSRLALGSDPLELAIAHWVDNVLWLQEGHGLLPLHESAGACALCVVYRNNECRGCPLYTAGMGCSRVGSPYILIDIADTIENQLVAAQGMLEALKGLRQEEPSRVYSNLMASARRAEDEAYRSHRLAAKARRLAALLRGTEIEEFISWTGPWDLLIEVPREEVVTVAEALGIRLELQTTITWKSGDKPTAIYRPPPDFDPQFILWTSPPAELQAGGGDYYSLGGRV